MNLFEGDDEASEVIVPNKKIRREAILPSVRPYCLNARVFAGEPTYASDALGLATGLDSIGGGRGYVATRFVEAGELLLVEKPVDAIDPELLAPLHPLEGTLEEKIITNSFESGLYLYQALFNDAAQPNCVQLWVDDDQADEVWCVRPTRRGEPLTLSYVQPMEATLFRRQTQLAHHGFLGDPPSKRPPLADYEDALDDATDDAALDIVKALLQESSIEGRLVLRRAFAVVARLAQDHKVALNASLAWLDALDHGGYNIHPDATEAAGIASDALAYLAPRSSRASINEAAGRDWSTAAELHAALHTLRSRADHGRAVFDSRRWLQQPVDVDGAARPPVP